MTSDSGAAVLILRPRPASYLVPRAAVGLLVLSPVVILGLTGSAWTFVLVGTAAALSQLAVPVTRYVAARRQPWAVEIGPDGVRWHGGVDLPWWLVAEVRVTRGWWSLFQPPIRLVDRRQAEFSSLARSRPLWHVIDTRHLDSSTDSVVTAIRRYADVTVIDGREPRS